MGGLVVDLLVGIILAARALELVVGGVQARPIGVRAGIFALVVFGRLLVIAVVVTLHLLVGRIGLARLHIACRLQVLGVRVRGLLGAFVFLADLLDVAGLLLALGIVEGRPRLVVVALEQRLHLDDVALRVIEVRGPLGVLHDAVEQVVELGRHERADRLLDLREVLLAVGVLLAREARRAHLHRDALDDDIARQRPCLPVAQVVAVVRVTEDAVQDEVQVVAHRLVEGLLEARQDAIGLEVDVRTVRRKGVAGAGMHRDELHAPQRQVEEAELQHELDATFLDDVSCEAGGTVEALGLLVGDLRHASALPL